MRRNKNPEAVTLGLIQMACENDPDANLKKAVGKISEAADRGGQIICLQELFRSRYFAQSEDPRHFELAESIPGETTEQLAKLASEKQVVIVAPLFERHTEGLYHNTAVVLDADGSILGKYRKMHIPDDPYYYEKFYFTPGDGGFKTFETRYARIGVLICWDQWFPEAARLTALCGAQILFYPSAIGWLEKEAASTREKERSAWEIVQRAHAVANGVFVAVTNRVGTEDRIQFWGSSFVSDPFGEVQYHASADQEEVLIVTCDLGKIEATRAVWPFLRDRRTDAYEEITHRFMDVKS